VYTINQHYPKKGSEICGINVNDENLPSIMNKISPNPNCQITLKLDLEQVQEVINGTAAGQAPNLKNIDLSGIEFPAGFDFRGADLSGTNLTGTNLTGTNLKNIKFSPQTNFNNIIIDQTAIKSYVDNLPAAKHQEIIDNPLVKAAFPGVNKWQASMEIPSSSISSPSSSQLSTPEHPRV